MKVFKAFIKSFEAPKTKSVKIKISLNFFPSSGIGMGRVKSLHYPSGLLFFTVIFRLQTESTNLDQLLWRTILWIFMYCNIFWLLNKKNPNRLAFWQIAYVPVVTVFHIYFIKTKIQMHVTQLLLRKFHSKIWHRRRSFFRNVARLSTATLLYMFPSSCYSQGFSYYNNENQVPVAFWNVYL